MKKHLAVVAVLALSFVALSPKTEDVSPVFPVPTPADGISIMQPTGNSPAVSIVNSLPILPTGPADSTAAVSRLEVPKAANNTYASAIENKRLGTRAVTVDGTSYPIYSYRSAAIPNDPNADQSFVTTANLSAAWDIPRGSTETVLAVIDTGFALQHEEFAGRFYSNPGETGPATTENPSLLNCTDRALPLDMSCNLIDDNGDGTVDNEIGATTYQNPSRLNCTAQTRTIAKDCNLVDDDSNGYVDDFRGWDFINNDRSVQAGEVTPTGAGTHHGSYVTGVAAATGNNAKGIAGVDWGTKILPIQALDDESYGDTVSVANAINYATSQGADVISLSLGSTGNDQLVLQAVRRAVAAGIIVVAAAGNDGCDCMLYPANYPEVIAVGASTSTGQPASFSSFGTNLDILAPGVNLFTTDWTAANPTSAYASGISGTSLATPVVAGLLTRLISQRPTATTAQLLSLLTENANPLGLTATAPRSNNLGFGLLDGGKSSQRLVNSYAPAQMINLTKINQVGTAGAMIYQCDPSVRGTTPVFELVNPTARVFTTDIVEQQTLLSQGYTSSILNYSCMTQAHDTPQAIRNLNVFSEFRNIFTR